MQLQQTYNVPVDPSQQFGGIPTANRSVKFTQQASHSTGNASQSSAGDYNPTGYHYGMVQSQSELTQYPMEANASATRMQPERELGFVDEVTRSVDNIATDRHNMNTLRYDTSPNLGGAYECSGCSKAIIDLRFAFYIDILGKWYHQSCFKCKICTREFSDALPYVPHNGDAVCEPDYERLMLPICAACKDPITDGSLVNALGRSFHERHLRCRMCKHRIQDGKAHVHNKRIYCFEHYQTVTQGLCAGCQRPAEGDCIQAMGKIFHRQCLTCTACHKWFPDKVFFVHNQQPYCEYDYHQVNNTICGTCLHPIEGECVEVSDMASRFHPDCWCCAYCNIPLRDIYYIFEGNPYCDMDIGMVFSQGNREQFQRTTMTRRI